MTNLPSIAQDVWKPATEADKMAALAGLGSLPSRATSSATLDKAAYYVALEGVTRYGLARAVKAILQGALGHEFFPSPPALRAQCDKAMEPHEEIRDRVRHREQLKAERIPDRPEPTPEEKARVAAIYRRFCESTKASNQREATEAERAEIRARYGITHESVAGIKDQPFTGQRLGKQQSEA